MRESHEVPLASAAMELQATWPQAYNLLLSGRLEGRKVRGRWLVSRESVEREKLERSGRAVAEAAA